MLSSSHGDSATTCRIEGEPLEILEEELGHTAVKELTRGWFLNNVAAIGKEQNVRGLPGVEQVILQGERVLHVHKIVFGAL
jgi:hypothetical protein